MFSMDVYSIETSRTFELHCAPACNAREGIQIAYRLSTWKTLLHQVGEKLLLQWHEHNYVAIIHSEAKARINTCHYPFPLCTYRSI